MVSRKGIATDNVQTNIPFLLIISTHYVTSIDHVHPLCHLYKQLLIEKECGTSYNSQHNNGLSLLSMMLHLQISQICQSKTELNPLVCFHGQVIQVQVMSQVMSSYPSAASYAFTHICRWCFTKHQKNSVPCTGSYPRIVKDPGQVAQISVNLDSQPSMQIWPQRLQNMQPELHQITTLDWYTFFIKKIKSILVLW